MKALSILSATLLAGTPSSLKLGEGSQAFFAQTVGYPAE